MRVVESILIQGLFPLKNVGRMAARIYSVLGTERNRYVPFCLTGLSTAQNPESSPECASHVIRGLSNPHTVTSVIQGCPSMPSHTSL